MGVTVEGVKGYEYQYKVTVLIALLKHIDKVEMFVEAVGSEDALLKIKKSNIDIPIEVQVKRESNLLNVTKLVSWLTHFQENKSDNNLLQRIIDNQETLALFVTHSRCSDDTVFLKSKLGHVDAHQNISISNKWGGDFISVLNKQKFGKTKLMLEREQFCQNQSKRYTSTSILSNILARVLIWEEFSDDKVDNEVLRLLNSEYQITLSEAPNVYLNLLEIVKVGRDTGNNILPYIKQAVQERRIGRPLINDHYIIRDEETVLLDFIINNNALLLTGISQCGKSELAKKVALHFFYKGYDYLRTVSVEEIARFFSTNTEDNKIAILEDTWGHLELVPDSEDKKRKLENIIANIQSHHKLVVTSRLEVLFEAFDTEYLNECKLSNIQWHDLTLRDSDKLTYFFNELAKGVSLPKEIHLLVEKNIPNTDNKHLLQLGQLRYLLNEDFDLLRGKNFQEIDHIARRNSKEIAISIKQRDEFIAEVLSVLALCTNPIFSVNHSDLAYIFSNSTQKTSIAIRDDSEASFRNKDPFFPEYPEQFYLSKEVQRALEYLEERQLITVSNEEVIFSHPNYFEAGRNLLLPKSEAKQKRILEYFQRCLSCLNPTTAHLATKQFSFLHNKIRGTLKSSIINLAFMSLDSIFPSVEDSSLVFLMNLIENLEEEQSERIIHYIQRGGTSSSSIYFYNNRIPFISNHSSLSNLFIKVDNDAVKEAEEELSKNLLPNTYKAWMYLEDFKPTKQAQLHIFKLLLAYNEAFIRKKVVYLLFHRLDQSYGNIVNQIFDDEHPDVVFSAIRATFINWFRYTQDIRHLLFELVKISLQKRQVAIRAYNLISTFSIDYGNEGIFNWRELNSTKRKELWNLWGELYPITVRDLPLNVHINTARFGASMDEAIKYLDVNIGIKVMETWLERIDYQIKHSRILDEFELAIALSLMELTKQDHLVRKNIFTQLVTYNDTNFILSNLKWIISFWESLHISEKTQILDLLRSNRIDLRWIKAVLLCSSSPPKEIILEILGEKNLLDKEVDYILANFPAQLLRDCLNVYFGFPQPLWWLAVHGKNYIFWNSLITNILFNETHNAFDLCLQHFVNDGVNGFSSRWRDGLVIWKQVCNKTADKYLLAESLIYNIARCSCSLYSIKGMWAALIDSYTEVGNENEIASVIADNIELLQLTNDARQLINIFPNDFFIKKILPDLLPDNTFIALLTEIQKNDFFSKEDKIKVVSSLSEIVALAPLRFLGTFNFFKSIEGKKGIPTEVTNILNSIPNHIRSVGKNKLDEQKQDFEYKLQDWIGVN